MNKLFYRPAEAAVMLSQGRTKIFEAIGRGELASIKVGGSRLISADALRRYATWLESQTNAR